ncbi:MAG: M81 family metallopeptidase [Deinococcota bacterium]
MKIFVAGVITETNTFSPLPTGLADFEVTRASDLEQAASTSEDGTSEDGVLETLQRKAHAGGHEFIFSLVAFAQPAGLTVRTTYETLRDEFLADLEAALPVDIVILPLHGAMVAEGYEDCEGDMIARVRELVGEDTVIGVELDLHCHLTETMVAKSDLIVIYKEYPHTDMAVRAEELFELAVATAEGRIKPTMSMFDCKMIGMYLTPFEPMRGFVDEMITAEGNDGVLSLSLAHCFPWGDVAECGTRMLAITDGDPQKATEVAQAFGKKFFDMRHDVSFKPLSLDEALDKALTVTDYPVVIADQADNAGGGAPSDSTYVLAALLERSIHNVALGMMYDPIVVDIAKAAGVGATITVRLGGKLGKSSGDPLDLEVVVTAIKENMAQRWPQDGDALTMNCGDAVRLHVNGIDIVVNSKRQQVFSPDIFTELGIVPQEKHLLIVKSIQHFYAGFAPIASEIIYMAAPGGVAPIMEDIPYQHVDLHKFPWVDDPFAQT